MPAVPFLFPSSKARHSDTQTPISRQHDGTGLQESFWVLRSDTATASRHGLAFEGVEEEKEDSYNKNSSDDPGKRGFFRLNNLSLVLTFSVRA